MPRSCHHRPQRRSTGHLTFAPPSAVAPVITGAHLRHGLQMTPLPGSAKLCGHAYYAVSSQRFQHGTVCLSPLPASCQVLLLLLLHDGMLRWLKPFAPHVRLLLQETPDTELCQQCPFGCAGCITGVCSPLRSCKTGDETGFDTSVA